MILLKDLIRGSKSKWRKAKSLILCSTIVSKIIKKSLSVVRIKNKNDVWYWLLIDIYKILINTMDYQNRYWWCSCFCLLSLRSMS